MSTETDPRNRAVRIEAGADVRSYVSNGQRVTLVPLTFRRRQHRPEVAAGVVRHGHARRRRSGHRPADAAELAVFQAGEDCRAVTGRVVGKGLADELHDKGYLIVDCTDGKAHYIALPARSELEQYPTGSVVEGKRAADVRAADRNIAALAVDGVYRINHHLASPKVSHARPRSA